MPELDGALHICSLCRRDQNHATYMVVDNDSNVVCNHCVATLIEIDKKFREKKDEQAAKQP